MPIEAELKARVRDPEVVDARIRQRGEAIASVYRDAYFDWPSGDLSERGYEARIRVVDSETGTKTLLTYKEPAVDSASGSKPEYETMLGDGAALRALLLSIGLVERIAFSKHCTNVRFTERGRDMLATLVRVPELDGTFLELETVVATESEVPAALDDVRAVLVELGITEADLTTEQYTDAVAAQRRTRWPLIWRDTGR